MFILAAGSTLESIGQLISVLFIFIFVLVLCFYTTKFIGGYSKQRSNNKNLKIIETIGLGPNKTIVLVEAGDTYLVVAVGKENVSLLTQLSRDQLKDFSFENVEDKTFSQESFQDILDKLKDKFPKK